MNSITITGPHLDRVNIDNIFEYWLNCGRMEEGFGFEAEDTIFDFCFESLDCPLLSPSSLDDVADIFQMNKNHGSLTPQVELPEDTASVFSELDGSFSMLCHHQLDDTFTSEDRWPI